MWCVEAIFDANEALADLLRAQKARVRRLAWWNMVKLWRLWVFIMNQGWGKMLRFHVKHGETPHSLTWIVLKSFIFISIPAVKCRQFLIWLVDPWSTPLELSGMKWHGRRPTWTFGNYCKILCPIWWLLQEHSKQKTCKQEGYGMERLCISQNSAI